MALNNSPAGERPWCYVYTLHDLDAQNFLAEEKQIYPFSVTQAVRLQLRLLRPDLCIWGLTTKVAATNGHSFLQLEESAII